MRRLVAAARGGESGFRLVQQGARWRGLAEPEGIEPREAEPFEVDRLDEWALLTEVFRDAMAAPAADETERVAELLERYLRALRRDLASEAGVPPYVVFHDATLREMVQQRPLSEGTLLKISGVGDSKLERFGDALSTLWRDAPPRTIEQCLVFSLSWLFRLYC